VLTSTGTPLLDADAETLYRTRLLPAAVVCTPNLWEAGVLVGRALPTLTDQRAAARELAACTGGVVVVTGGHATTDAAGRSVDIVAGGGRDELATRERIDTSNPHGSGCSFASAVAAHLARGDDVVAAITAAGGYVHRAIVGGARWHLGAGHGPLDHFGWEEHE